MSSQEWAEWQKIFRDVTITVLATFLLVFEAVFAASPNAYVIGAALALFGVPPALRLDSSRKRKNGNGNGPDGDREGG